MQKLASDVDGALLPADVVCAAASRLVRSLLASGDANAAFQLRGDGRQDWGVGGGNALDTSLFRSGVNALSTPGSLTVGTYLNAGSSVNVSGKQLVRGPDGQNWTLIGGSSVVTTNSDGSATITFPFTPATNPAWVVATNGDPYSTGLFMIGTGTYTQTGFNVRCWQTQTTPYVGQCRINWLALVLI
jgi:hypothetical protein